MADSLAGVELSRLQWARDEEQGRPLLNFEGELAEMPVPLDDDSRLAVSFLLEEDRARAMNLRHPVVVLQRVFGAHMVAGRPAADSGRLDYRVQWAQATAENPVNHRVVTDEIAMSKDTPGARLSNVLAEEVHGVHHAC